MNGSVSDQMRQYPLGVPCTREVNPRAAAYSPAQEARVLPLPPVSSTDWQDTVPTLSLFFPPEAYRPDSAIHFGVRAQKSPSRCLQKSE